MLIRRYVHMHVADRLVVDCLCCVIKLILTFPWCCSIFIRIIEKLSVNIYRVVKPDGLIVWGSRCILALGHSSFFTMYYSNFRFMYSAHATKIAIHVLHWSCYCYVWEISRHLKWKMVAVQYNHSEDYAT